MQVTLMHNPGAGSGKPTAEELLEALKKAGYEPSYQSTKDDNFEEALLKAKDLVMVAGGDGTIGQVAKKMVDIAVPLTFLPIGTANNIAKTFNISGTPEELIGRINLNQKTKFNVGIISTPWGEKRFIEAVGFGIFPKMMEDYEKVKDENLSKEEEVKEALIFLKNIVKDAPAYPCKIKVDGEEFKDDFILVEVMNIKTIGPNLPLASDANPGDNYFEIVMITSQEREGFRDYLESYINGETPPIDLTIRRGSHIQFMWQKFKIHIDDDILPEEDEVDLKEDGEAQFIIDITMEKNKLDIIVPAL